MKYPVCDVIDGVYKPVPAGDGCSGELCKGPFSQPFPAYAEISALLKLRGTALERR